MKYGIEQYQFLPICTNIDIDFFRDNVFLTKENILSEPLSLKDIYAHQILNTFDFGKIVILPNGDIHANENFPPLGNITTHTIHEILYKEMSEGKSWFRIRTHSPCSDCIYQWLCPSPSNYEIEIGKPNLCHVNL